VLFNWLLYRNKHRCPVGEMGIGKKAGGRYATKVNADALENYRTSCYQGSGVY
jgi:hypothetical protein